MVRALLVANVMYFFVGGRFLGDSVELTEELSSSSSSSELLPKILVLVVSSSRNGWIAMLSLAVQSKKLLPYHHSLRRSLGALS